MSAPSDVHPVTPSAQTGSGEPQADLEPDIELSRPSDVAHTLADEMHGMSPPDNVPSPTSVASREMPANQDISILPDQVTPPPRPAASTNGLPLSWSDWLPATSAEV